MEFDIVCSRPTVGGCGFRVHDRYFEQKKKFAPGVCPRCAGPCVVVERGTDTIVPNREVNKSDGRVVVVPG